jgi:hypothetical protein
MEVLLVDTGWAEDPMALPIKPPQVPPAGTKDPVDSITRGVLIVVGVSRGYDWKVQVARHLESRDPKRELGSDVDYIGLKASGILEHIPEPGECPLNVGIQKQRHAGRAVHLRTIWLSLRERVRGGIHAHLVAALFQGAGEPQQRDSYAAHHRPVDLGKQGNPHQRTLDRRVERGKE